MNLLGLPGCNEKKNILWCFLLNLSVVKKLWGRFFSSKKRGHRFLSESFLELILFLKLIPSCFFLNSPFHVYQIALPKRQQLSRKASQEPTTRYIWFVDSQNCRWCARKESSSPKKIKGDVNMDGPHGPKLWTFGKFSWFFLGGKVVEATPNLSRFCWGKNVPKFRVATGALFRGSFWAGDLLILVFPTNMFQGLC